MKFPALKKWEKKNTQNKRKNKIGKNKDKSKIQQCKDWETAGM